MPDQPVSRRTIAIALAGGALGAQLAPFTSREQPPDDTEKSSGQQEHADRTEHADRAPDGADRSALLAPLAAGSRVLSWEVEAIEPLAMGALRVRMRCEDGASFGVEIMKRDRSPIAARPPAQTEQFALFVNNGGDGGAVTAETQGLAAMALAQIVARNEAAVATDGFMTHSERIAEHPIVLLEHVDGTNLPGPLDPRARVLPAPVVSPQRGPSKSV